jgi:hypothetical protein
LLWDTADTMRVGPSSPDNPRFVATQYASQSRAFEKPQSLAAAKGTRTDMVIGSGGIAPGIAPETRHGTLGPTAPTQDIDSPTKTLTLAVAAGTGHTEVVSYNWRAVVTPLGDIDQALHAKKVDSSH